jgi:hypothetical protein
MFTYEKKVRKAGVNSVASTHKGAPKHRTPSLRRPTDDAMRFGRIARAASSAMADGRVDSEPAAVEPGLPAGTPVTPEVGEVERATAPKKQLAGHHRGTTAIGEMFANSVGRPLPEALKSRYEASYGRSLSQVRVHDDAVGASIAKSLDARAVTVGSHIALASGQFAPHTTTGALLLGHEIAHAIQQSGSAEAAPDSGALFKVSSPSDDSEREAWRASSLALGFGSTALPLAPAPIQLQRTTWEERMWQALDLIREGLPSGIDPIASVFGSVITSNILSATPVTIPPRYWQKLIEYSAANLSDGIVLLAGLARVPEYYSGGWILSVQTGAAAMTLDRSIFVNGAPSIDTYVHEMVHVAQYAAGRTAFLTSYFGLSAATIAYRLLRRLPLEVMNSSPHESQAYAIESRFMSWYASHP